MTIVVGLCVVGLMAFGLALSYYKNILFNRQLVAMQDRNDKLKQDIMDGYDQLQYLQSSQYKDKYAKENFGLLKSGEKVLIINQPVVPVLLTNGAEPSEEEKQAVYEENIRNIRVIDQWRLFLFYRDQIEELKKAS